MNQATAEAYHKILDNCQQLFEKKNADYGSAWRVLRLPSITDQIFIKARRIREIQEQGEQQVADSIPTEFIGIINYSIMALIQLRLSEDPRLEIETEEALAYYKEYASQSMTLMQRKNHDYGEAWRNMRVSSITDIILMKLLRIKQIEDNRGITKVSEGVDANYMDIVNYAVFSLILLNFDTNL